DQRRADLPRQPGQPLVPVGPGQAVVDGDHVTGPVAQHEAGPAETVRPQGVPAGVRGAGTESDALLAPPDHEHATMDDHGRSHSETMTALPGPGREDDRPSVSAGAGNREAALLSDAHLLSCSSCINDSIVSILSIPTACTAR